MEECGKARKGCWPLVVACGMDNGGREAMGQGGEGHGARVQWSLEEDALVVSGVPTARLPWMGWAAVRDGEGERL